MSEIELTDRLDQAIDAVLAAPKGERPANVDQEIAELLEIAVELRDLPRADFKARLKQELIEASSEAPAESEDEPAGSNPREVRRTVTPYIVVSDVHQEIDFLQRVFGAEGKVFGLGSQGGYHSEYRIGDSMLMIGGGPSYKGPRKPVTLRVLVANSDEVYQRALDAGAISTLEITENYGERFGCVRDRFDNQWIISTQIGPAYSEGLDHNLTTFIKVHGAARYIDFVERSFGAKVQMRADGPDGKVRHSIIRMGDSIVAVSDAASEEKPSPLQLYLYVPDVDAWYDRAVRAGAQPSYPPTDQAYGDRGAGVTDEWGNFWYMATPLL